MTFIASLQSELSILVKLLLGFLFFVPLYFFYISGITKNPPGFYMDEAVFSYNAYTIYLKGQGEFGDSWPLFLPAFRLNPPFNFVSYMDPVQIYLLAALYNIFPPSVTLARGLSATGIFVAALLLGLLAKWISGRTSIVFIITLAALMTPWLFELGRLAFGAALYPLAIVLFLLALYNAYRKENWTILDCVLIGFTLAGATYTYAVGRLLGPLLALGLLFFATDLKRFKNVFITWAAYGIFLLPILIFHILHPGALAGRFNNAVAIVKPDLSVVENLSRFAEHYLENISLTRLLYTGDPILRHHITNTPAFLAPVFILCVIGLIVVIMRHRSETWWRYIVFCIIITPVPSSLTIELFHSLRLSALPVFLLVLAIPALMLFFESPRDETPSPSLLGPFLTRPFRFGVLAILLVGMVLQAFLFQVSFDRIGPSRGRWFDDAYPKLFDAAVAEPSRPIYLIGHSYILAYWQAAVKGIDVSNFVYIEGADVPPPGSLVLSGELDCTECDKMIEEGGFILYTKLGGGIQAQKPAPAEAPTPTPSKDSTVQGQFSKPRGIAADSKGNLYVADTGNARIQQFSPTGEFITNFGNPGSGDGELSEPIGVAVDAKGNIYVGDGTNNRLIKLDPKGTFVKQWSGPPPGFYGLRDIAVGPDPHIYVIDQGRARVVKIDPDSEAVEEWGKSGEAEGEFNEMTGIAIGGNRIFIADARNDRVQVFDLTGKFITQWPVPQWAKYIWHYPDIAFDEESNRVYVTSGWSQEVLVFDMNGNLVESIKPNPTSGLNNPSSIVISRAKNKKSLNVLNTGNVTVETGNPSISIFDLSPSSSK